MTLPYAPTAGYVPVSIGSGTIYEAQTPPAAPPSGAAGGNLAGTYPNPTVINLSFLTTRGDLAYRNATTATRLPLGGAGALLTSDGTDAKWLALGASGRILYSDGTGAIWATLAAASILSTAGGTMSGNIAMGGFKITGSVVPTAAGEAMVVPASVANVDLFYWLGGTLVRLPKGTALQVLRVNTDETALEWVTPSGGGPTLGISGAVNFFGVSGPINGLVTVYFSTVTGSITDISVSDGYVVNFTTNRAFIVVRMDGAGNGTISFTGGPNTYINGFAFSSGFTPVAAQAHN